MKRHLMSACIWLCTLILAVLSATETPRVSVVQQHALNHTGIPAYASQRSGAIDTLFSP